MGIFDRMDKMTRRERIVKKAVKKMEAGETWVCPLELEKGADYSFSATTGSRTNVRCSLFNGKEAPVAQSEVGTKVSLSVAPEEDGVHKLMIEASADGSAEPKVALTVRKAYVPSRVQAWLYQPAV
jgi:hypothetical protein